ncbi:MAG TPA: BREX-2 system phosphatase PglZ [Burkholderiaceae bacterium]|nr:BREX-2 system phosphatase PglZ [Burkholderiaceae bacterium]
MSLSTPQIAAQLDRVLSSDPTAAAVAIRATARQPWPESLTQRGRQFSLRWCESSLAIREALCDNEQHDPASAGLVVITPLATHEVAEDIAARLARGRVYQPEGWDIVRQLFQAKETDARLGRFAWMPQALIDGAAQGQYTPVANGFLDLETAWREVLQRFLGLKSARPDAVALLQWCSLPGSDAALRLMPAATRTDLTRWLSEAAGTAGAMVLACVDAGRTADALALGLVCGVVYAPAGEGQAALGQAAIRLERYVGDKHVGIAEGRAWSQAAEQAVRTAGPDAMRGALDRADSLLNELRIAEFAHLSDLLPSSLDQRMRAFAAALSAHVAAPGEAQLARVEQLADGVLKHALAAGQQQRMERVEMARRLARWLMLPAPSAANVTTAVGWQADEGAFVDWARFRLLGGDELTELDHAYDALRAAAIARRNAFDQPFAQTLLQWNAQTPGADGRVVPIESVLDRVLGPIAASQPVLLLVMDGLSTSIYRELFSRINNLGWVELVPADVEHPLVGVAALPTVTEVSRTSLLCGRLALGTAANEKTGFANHTALLAHSRSEVPPRLFHKGELADSTNLSQEVRATIANPQQRVVGVVYNAVDDHLSGPDQLHQRWALEDLRLLLPLLREAREARRVVVITADHGHLLEDGTTQVTGASAPDKVSDRWRPGRDARAPHEVAFSGGRVVTADNSKAVVCLWGESTRYAGRKNGYHGGVSPQEVAVPLSVVVPLGMNLAGWQLAPPAQPEWWELPHLAPVPAPAAAPAPAARPAGRKTPTAPVAQPSLFEPQEAPTLPPIAAAAAADDWIGALLSSSIYASQRQLAARVALPDDKMRLLLVSLSERGGKLSRAALAQRLALPEVRLGGLLSAVRRMLNVDQAPVLTVDESAGTIELNRALLMQQFRVSTQGGPR